MPRISLISRPHLLIVCIALLVATAAVACGGDDVDEPEPPASPAAGQAAEGPSPDDDATGDAGEQSARAEPEQRAVAEEQAEEQADDRAEDQAAAEEAVAEAEEDEAAEEAVEQAAEQAAEQTDEQPAEQPAEQAAEQAEEQAEAQAAEPAGEEPAEEVEEAVEDVEDDAPDAAVDDEIADDGDDDAPLVGGPIVEYARVEDVRFQAVIAFDMEPSGGGDDLALLTAFGDITVEGVYLASGDHEISIKLGESAFLPPMGIVSIGDTLYTNLGFGWEASQGSTGALVEGLSGDLLGFDLGGLDLEGLLTGGDIGIVLSGLPYESWDDRGGDTLDAGPARVYALQTDSLGALFASLGDDLSGDEAGLAIGLGMLSEFATLDSLEITLWIDEATGAAARLALAIAGLSLKGFAGPDADLRVGSLALDLDASPEFGLLTNLRLAVEGLDIPGPEGLSGDLVITLDVTDVNAGDVVIEPPI
jgi:hypothetical protein